MSEIYGGLLSDPELKFFFSDDVTIQSMIEVEVALAKVQGKNGIIPLDAAHQIEIALSSFQPNFENIASDTEISGVPTIALIKQLREAAGEAGDYIHWGATSQDIIDTGLVLRLGKCLLVIEQRLDGVCAALARLMETHRKTVMIGRTRFQNAIPTTFGMKVAVWLDGLLSAREGLQVASQNMMQVQFGGAVGTLAALSHKGVEVADALAAELNLKAASVPWHTNRTSFVAFANQLSLITGTLGKIGQDIVLLSQSEVGEVTIEAGGGSSTMPQKANPVLAETLVSLSKLNSGLIGMMHQSLVQEHERSGIGWQLELMVLPQMVMASGAALRHADTLLGGISINQSRMTENLRASKGVVMAEAAVFALSEHMASSSARDIVKGAVAESIASNKNLAEVLQNKSSLDIDWPQKLDPAGYLGGSETFINRMLAKAKSIKD